MKQISLVLLISVLCFSCSKEDDSAENDQLDKMNKVEIVKDLSTNDESTMVQKEEASDEDSTSVSTASANTATTTTETVSTTSESTTSEEGEIPSNTVVEQPTVPNPPVEETPVVTGPPVEIPAGDDASSSSDNEQNVVEDQKIMDTKSAFFQLEQKIQNEIGFEFLVINGKVKSSLKKRCDFASTNDLKNCLIEIKKSLESFIKEGNSVLGMEKLAPYRVEQVKLSLANDWLNKINRHIHSIH